MVMHILWSAPYYGGGHGAWADGYARHSAHTVELLVLPVRFWRWRMHGGAVTLAEAARDLAFQPDAILAKAYEFEAARERLGTHVIHYGWADRETYARLLWQADVVVSTALHEFFGISVVEAVYCGCFPLLPRRLAYREVIPESHHDTCLYDGFEDLSEYLRWALTAPDAARRAAHGLREAMARYDWASMAPRYDAALAELLQE
jgi:glycosyltransferase involved in cell wall biosynthesis